MNVTRLFFVMLRFAFGCTPYVDKTVVVPGILFPLSVMAPMKARRLLYLVQLYDISNFDVRDGANEGKTVLIIHIAPA
jgi:hypothetical protein